MTHFYSAYNEYQHQHEIKGVVFDLDGTLYTPSDALNECQVESAIVAAQNQLPQFEKDEIRNMVMVSREQYRGSLNIFVVEHGAKMPNLRRDQFAGMIKNTSNGFFGVDAILKNRLDELHQNVGMVIGTHGSHAWTEHVLSELDISEFFPTAQHITKGDVDNIGKNVGPQMCDACLDVLGAPETEGPSRRGEGYAVVEDTMENLKSFKERGMMTIFIRRESSHLLDDDIADYVDVVVKEGDLAIEAILDSNMQHSGVHPELSADF